MTITVYVAAEDLAVEFDQEPAELFQVLELIADRNPSPDGFLRCFAEGWSGSVAADRVLPLLRGMVDALEAASQK